ncbi:MAG TPA: SDR family oxidoreductase, partial [Acidimicrobiales bacterium]|nr:SDR family oxidoreductase [Acidimicrobiales bacterium]
MSLLEERARLAGRVAVIAGGGGGLGRACALDLAGAGANLGLADKDRQTLSETSTEARALGAQVVEEVLDVRDSDGLAEFFGNVDTVFGRFDALVNVVGGTFRSDFTDVNAKGRDALVRTNLTWVLDAMSLGARHMAQHGRGGSIVTLTSIEAHRAAPGFAVYAACKAAVEHITRTLAVEFGPQGIRVNCVAPDFVPTSGLEQVARRAGSGGEVAAGAGTDIDPGDRLTIPLGRKGLPEDVGNCILFLVSDLSSYITGTTLHPDGGALAGSGWMMWPEDGFAARPPSWVLE